MGNDNGELLTCSSVSLTSIRKQRRTLRTDPDDAWSIHSLLKKVVCDETTDKTQDQFWNIPAKSVLDQRNEKVTEEFLQGVAAEGSLVFVYNAGRKSCFVNQFGVEVAILKNKKVLEGNVLNILYILYTLQQQMDVIMTSANMLMCTQIRSTWKD